MDRRVAPLLLTLTAACSYDWDGPLEGHDASMPMDAGLDADGDATTMDAVSHDHVIEPPPPPPPDGPPPPGCGMCMPPLYCAYPGHSCSGPPVCMKPGPNCMADMIHQYCACDHKLYYTPCDAELAGQDLNGGVMGNPCTPPQSMYPCGYTFCEFMKEVCVHHAVEDTFECFVDNNCMTQCPCLMMSNACGDGGVMGAKCQQGMGTAQMECPN